MKVVSMNLNGIRSAARKGFFEWISDHDPDIICVQETKAQMNAGLKADFDLTGYYSAFSDAEKKGYSGVGVFSKQKPLNIETLWVDDSGTEEGRYIQFTYENLNIVSLYLPSGTSGDERQAYKMDLLDKFYDQWLMKNRFSEKPWIICGDWNIAHTKKDIKNWRSNQNKSGFLPEERAWMDKVFSDGHWVDAWRMFHPEQESYSWWTYRAGARAKNVGWRIDYQVISASMAPLVQSVSMVKDPVFSDHGPVIVEYDYVINA